MQSQTNAIEHNQNRRKSAGYERPPCAVQFRMGGCKGVLAVDPQLGDVDKIVIRPKSMQKFESNDEELEVVAFSRPRETIFCFTVNLRCHPML